MTDSLYIYGAGIVATSIYTAIKELYHAVPQAFVVSDMQGNPDTIDGIPVKELSAIAVEPTAKYVIAAPEVHHSAIAESLCDLGVQESQLIFVDNRLENELMEKYYREEPGFETVLSILDKSDIGEVACKRAQNDESKQGIEGQRSSENCAAILSEFILVAQAKCHVDKPLTCAMEMPGYIYPLQVGAVFAEEVIASLRDNEGENISAKNRNYCELTANYAL